MNHRLFICGLCVSHPVTMGGNTKIAIEMARCLSKEFEVHVFLPRYKLPTFTDNLPGKNDVVLHPLSDYPKNDKYHPIGASLWYTKCVRELFKHLNVGSADIVFNCSDFHTDVIPMYVLQNEFRFRWIPSVFLFVPFVTENLLNGYRFPVFKYLVYWIYQRVLFFLMKRRASAFVVTNKSDFGKFPARFTDKLFAYYGGVNVEQIPDISAVSKSTTTFNVVFCSRLHPQKGIDAFLDVWKIVTTKSPHARLSIIGNGEPAYETYLKEKAKRLGIDNTISWLGYVNNEAKYDIYAKSNLLVHPTVFDNNGMVAAEALCTGLPVVMQDLPALRDVYTTGCIKVPFGDRDAFANAIVSCDVKLTDVQIADLRNRWCWEKRALDFLNWINNLK